MQIHSLLNLFRDIVRRRPICLFGENRGETANNNSWYFWLESDFKRKEFGSYYVVKDGRKRLPPISRTANGYVIKQNSLAHWLAYVYSTLHVVTLGFRDTVPSQLWRRPVAQRSRHPVIHLGHGVLGIKKSGYSAGAYGGNLFRRCAFSDFDEYVLANENGLFKRQVWRWPALPRHYGLAKIHKQLRNSNVGPLECLWFVTWREYLENTSSHLKFIERTVNDIEALLDSGVTLTVVLHHHFDENIVEHLKTNFPEIVFGQYEYDLLGALARSHQVITDFSSVALEAYSLGKHVVLYAPDFDSYLSGRSTYHSAIRLEAAMLHSTSELIDALRSHKESMNKCDEFLQSVSPKIDWDEVASGRYLVKKHDELAELISHSISFLGYDFTGTGGTVSATANLAEALADRGFLVFLISIRGRRKLKSLPGVHHRGIIGGWPRLSKMNLLRLFNFLSINNPFDADPAIHRQRPPQLMSPIILRMALRLAPARVLVSTRESLHLPLVRCASAKSDQTIILMFHTPVLFFREKFPKVVPQLERLFSLDHGSNFHYVTVTRNHAQDLCNEFSGVEIDQIDVIGNTLRKKYFDAAADALGSGSARLCSASASLGKEAGSPDKKMLNVTVLTRMSSDRRAGLQRILELAEVLRERIPQAHIRVFGSGSEVPWFRSAIYDCHNVVFEGNADDSLQLILEADLVFEPHSEHSFGMVILESLVLEKPVLAWRSVGANEILGVDSPLICDDIESVVDRMVMFIDTLRSSYVASKLAREHFSQEAVSSRFLGRIGLEKRSK